MDQLSAHLERGWDLAQRGDTQGASASARRALELDPDSPEVHNLLGFVAALEGDSEEAIEAYQQAMLLDEGYIEAMLNAAELMVHPLEQFEEALKICEQVLEISDYPDEEVDALLVKFEALTGMGQEEEARKVLGKLPEGPYETASQNFLTGRAFYEAGDAERAHKLIEAALAQEPGNPEAHYYAGLMHEDLGDHRAACVAFLRTRQLELEMGLPPWAPNPETFLLFTQNALASLEPHQRAFMEDADLFVADLPGPEAVVDGVDPRSAVLVDTAFVGPSDDDEDLPLEVTPEQIQLRVFIYVLNVVRSAAGLHGVQQTIAEALATELDRALTDLAIELEHAKDLELQTS